MVLRNTTKRALAARAAFTLMEMLVVVAIIVIIAGMAVPTVMSYLEQSKVDAAKAGITKIDTAVNAFRTKHNIYPPNLLILTQIDPEYGTPAPLRPKDLLDPWGHEYQYSGPDNVHPESQRPIIASGGPHPGRSKQLTNHD